MANFMNKMKTPKPIKPIKPISEVKSPEKPQIAETKNQEPETPEIIDQGDETTGRLPGETEEERIDRQVTEVLGEEEPETDPEEDDKIDDQADEEIIEDANKDPEPEPEPEKTKKKTTRKSKKKTEKSKQEDKIPVAIEQAETLMLDEIMPSTEDWLEEKERVNGLLGQIVITEELDPTSVKALLASMSAISRELSILTSEAKTAYTNLKEMVDQIRTENSIGSNSEERKLNGIHALRNYPKDDEIVDLTVLIKVYREKQDFYESAMKQLDINRQMLITFSSVFKIELGQAY